MFEFIRLYQMDIMLALSAACASFGLLLFFTQFLEKRRKFILITMEFVATFLLFFDRMAYVYAGDASHTGYVMVRVSNFMVFFLTAAIVMGFNLYLTDLLCGAGMEENIPKRLKLVTVASCIAMLMVVVSQFTGLYYTFDENNVYHRGPGFLICYLIPVICPLIQYTVILQYKKLFSKLIYVSLVLYIFIPIIVGIIQIFQYGISIVNMAMVLVSISLYIFTYLDINRDVLRAHQIEVGELKEGEKKMERLFDQTTTAFVKAIERKDVYAKGHSEKVAALARRIAEMAGMDSDKCNEVYYAALLHDIGMIGIPDSILEKTDDLTEEEKKVIQSKPIISSEILSEITEYPYLKDGVLYSSERYDGTGYPKGLKENEIPVAARIIAVADSYVSMNSNRRYRQALPYITIRQEFVENAGSKFDPEFANIMIRIMDMDFMAEEDERPVEEELVCENYKDRVSVGIPVTSFITNISFTYSKIGKGDFSAPSIVLFDSYDRLYHDDFKSIKAFKYYEYGEVWPDGHFVSTKARNMVVNTLPCKADGRSAHSMEIIASKYNDHVKIEMKTGGKKVTAIVALEDNSKSAYIGITGENCHIKDIVVNETDTIVHEGDIERISDSTSYIDRLESDLPNIQVDTTRSAATSGVALDEELRLFFHYLSLPCSNLVWHCPYFVVFYSDDGEVYGEGYREYALIKLNGEISGDETCAENSFTMKKTEEFQGWDKWKEVSKAGVECSALFMRRGNKVIMKTENLGIAIENTTTIKEGAKGIYVALTGDEVAITDIRVM